jgi:glutamate-1-semialdehyde 2,1-aminomutase
VTDIDPALVAELTDREEATLAERLLHSIAFAKRATQALAGGVACTWHALTPFTIYGTRGEGSHLWDLDGNEYVDLHAGYGVMVVGNAHPKIVEAVRERVGLGTHFALPVEETIEVAELLAERFGLPLWRFKNSGSEATMEACRIMRAATGRELVIKVEGCYHGSSDGLAFSYWIDPEDAGPRDRPAAVPNTGGVAEVFGRALRIVPFNDLGAVERVLGEDGERVAGMILEPVMMNVGVIEPEPGYLAALRDLLHRYGALLAFDEVKTGAVIAGGGARERFGVTPDVIALAKAIGGGLPIGAVGGTEDAMRVLVDGTMEGEGTFNGNPLSMVAAKAVLAEILTPDAYGRLEASGRDYAEGIRGVAERHDLPVTVAACVGRGSVHYRSDRPRDYREAVDADDSLAHLAWLFQANGGVFIPPGDPWTVSIVHTDGDLQRSVEAFDVFATAVTT